MISPRRLAYALMSAVVVGACSGRVEVPEIPLLDPPAFEAAKREPEPKPLVKYIEVPKPLPLPGQLKPVPKTDEKAKDEGSPKERIAGAHDAARIEPAKDGYINAIQVYPYTKGALYQVYAAVNPGDRHRAGARREAACPSPPATRCAGWSAIPAAARARTSKFISW